MMSSTLEKKVLGGLGLASLIIAGVTVIYHVKTSGLVHSTGRVMQAHAMTTALSDLSRGVLLAQMCTRGHVLTGDADLLRMYREALRDTDRALAALRESAGGDPHCSEHVTVLEQLVRRRLERFRRLMELKRSTGSVVAWLMAGIAYREEIDDPLRERFLHLQDHARQELLNRQRLARAGQRGQLTILIFGALVELAFVAGATMIIRRDLLSRKRAAREIEERELTLRSFYESGVTKMGIMELLDDDLRVVSGNSATARMFPAHSGPIEGRLASELGTPPQVIALFVEKCRESFRLGGPVAFEYQRLLPDGEQHWLSTVVCPIRRWAPAGEPRFSYIMQDVTARKAAEAALEQARREADAANAAKSNFLANMSHEIRTPMTSILGYGDLLTEPGRSDAERNEWVGVIRRNSRHLLDLINDILDLSKIEAGKMTLESAPLDPSTVVSEVVASLRHRAAAKGIVLRLDLEPPIPATLRGDALRLRQVLVNLIGNAIKFTEAGEVAVTMACDGMALEIQVRDTGIGMSAQQLGKLFRPFTQADETTTRKFGGTGLGLSICQRLVSLMGGTLTAESEPGIGSAFSVTLPATLVSEALPPDAVDEASPSPAGVAAAPCADVRAAADLRAAAAPRAAEHRHDGATAGYTDDFQAAGLSGLRALLAEDSPDMQRLMMMLLRRAGLDVTLAPNGRVAIDLATARTFDVVLMDMQMPEVDGYCAAAELRRRGVGVPIIAVTAHAMSGDRERCLAAGCSDYLTKPVDPALLLRTAARHIALKRGGAAAA